MFNHWAFLYSGNKFKINVRFHIKEAQILKFPAL